MHTYIRQIYSEREREREREREGGGDREVLWWECKIILGYDNAHWLKRLPISFEPCLKMLCPFEIYINVRATTNLFHCEWPASSVNTSSSPRSITVYFHFIVFLKWHRLLATEDVWGWPAAWNINCRIYIWHTCVIYTLFIQVVYKYVHGVEQIRPWCRTNTSMM